MASRSVQKVSRYYLKLGYYLAPRFPLSSLAFHTFDVPERLRYRYWLHYAEGSAMPPLLMKLIFDKIEERSPFFLRPIVRSITQPVRSSLIDPQITTHLDYLEAELAHYPWFAGNDAIPQVFNLIDGSIEKNILKYK
jgi:glutathione S-transferase